MVCVGEFEMEGIIHSPYPFVYVFVHVYLRTEVISFKSHIFSICLCYTYRDLDKDRWWWWMLDNFTWFPLKMCCAVLQVGRDYRDFLGIISSIVLNKNICYDPLLVPSQQDGSNEGLKYTFS